MSSHPKFCASCGKHMPVRKGQCASCYGGEH